MYFSSMLLQKYPIMVLQSFRLFTVNIDYFFPLVNVLCVIFSKCLDLDSQFLKDCEYIDVLASTESQDSLFPTRIKLLPPDIVKQIEQSRREKGLTEKDK